ncbi:Chymotrypsinogen B [Galemys pyrenaicus]|uniref:Chymotrypsinogen B n=1 Tax=Galemys pyrenaicus TaxID=202257 RepID=A0A8J6B7V2_GALPY|nr:Chymotrypsinogen B [Galemys pyrenaicus]
MGRGPQIRQGPEDQGRHVTPRYIKGVPERAAPSSKTAAPWPSSGFSPALPSSGPPRTVTSTCRGQRPFWALSPHGAVPGVGHNLWASEEEPRKRLRRGREGQTSSLVVAGMFDRHAREDGVQILKISQIFRHHNFNEWSIFNDIALLRLATPAHFNNYVSPVLLPRTYYDFFPGTFCIIMGWGKTRISGRDFPGKLQQAKVPIMSMATCRRYWPHINTHTIICAGSYGARSYHGDSGGSLVCKKNGLWTLAGVLCYSSKTCRACKHSWPPVSPHSYPGFTPSWLATDP